MVPHRTRTHFNAKCQWHLAATSSKTGCHYTVLPCKTGIRVLLPPFSDCHLLGGAPLWCGQDSNPFQCQMPVAFGSNQFKNWLPPYGFAVQNRQSSPVAPPSVTATFWVALLFGADQDSNPFQCQMPVAFDSNQFKNWLPLYCFAVQNRQSSPVVPPCSDRHLLGGAPLWCGPGLEPILMSNASGIWPGLSQNDFSKSFEAAPLFGTFKRKSDQLYPKNSTQNQRGRFCLSKSVLFFSFVRYAAPGTNRWFLNRPVCILWYSFRL